MMPYPTPTDNKACWREGGCNYIRASEAFLPLRNTSRVKYLPQSAPLDQIQKTVSIWGSPHWFHLALYIFNIRHCLNACWIKLQHQFLDEKAIAYSIKIFHTCKHTSIILTLHIFVHLTPLQKEVVLHNRISASLPEIKFLTERIRVLNPVTKVIHVGLKLLIKQCFNEANLYYWWFSWPVKNF